MNKAILAATLISIGIFSAMPVYAGVPFPNPLGSTTLADIVTRISSLLLSLAIFVAPVLLVIGGIMFMTAAGDPNRISTGKRIILWTVIGFLIVLLARGIVNVVGELIGLP